jgi:hypothetical protein
MYSFRNSIYSRGRILVRNWDKSLKSFPSLLFTVTSTKLILPPNPSWEKVVCIRETWAWELSRLCPETSMKFYVHEYGFWILDTAILYSMTYWTPRELKARGLTMLGVLPSFRRAEWFILWRKLQAACRTACGAGCKVKSCIHNYTSSLKSQQLSQAGALVSPCLLFGITQPDYHMYRMTLMYSMTSVLPAWAVCGWRMMKVERFRLGTVALKHQDNHFSLILDVN